VTAVLRYFRTHKWIAIGLAYALLTFAEYQWLEIAKPVTLWGSDVMVKLASERRPAVDRIVIVDIDQRSLELMNYNKDYPEASTGRWPWPRSVHGELIDYIERQQPRAIAFDVLFNEDDIDRPEADALFAEAVARYPNVWLAMTLNSDGEGARVKDMPPAVSARPLTSPSSDAHVPLMMPLVLETQGHPEGMRGGLVNFTADDDGVGRHHLVWQDRSGWRFYSLPMRIAESLGRPLPDHPQFLLNWRSAWHHVSYADLYYDSLREHSLRDPNEFRGKVVLVGTSAPGLQDFRVTPLGKTTPGVEILATSLDNLLSESWLNEVPRPATAPFALALVALVSIGFNRGFNAQHIGYAMIAVTLVAVGTMWVLLRNGLFVPILVGLTLGWTFYLLCSAIAYLQERAQRLRTSTMFKRFLDPRVVADLIERGEIDYRQDARALEISVLFSDIRGFTTLSETSPPEEVVALLNRHFSRQVEVIFRHGGTLDKFIGDAIMAFWGAPTAYPDHAERAVAAALDMSAALEELRSELGALGATMDIGVGVHTGRAVVGCIGSTDRLDYTAIGDTVNLASRIEGLTKGVARILVSESTRLAVGERFGWKDCGFHRVKGRETPVRLYEPLPKAGISS
jgi:adenylate cyclase